MAMLGVGFFELLILFALGGSSGLPLGLPPKPQDPWLAQIAPAEPLYYVSWSERELNPAADGNETERLFAEPEVRKFLKKLDTAIARMLALNEESGDPWVGVAGDLSRAMLTRASCLFVAEAQLGAEGIEGEAALVIDVAGDRERFVARISEIIAMLQDQGIELTIEQVEIAGDEYQRFRLNPAAPSIDVGFHDKYLILAIGENTIERMLERSKGEPPAWLAQMHEDLAVPRVASVCYLDLKGIRERGRFATQLVPEIENLLQQFGVDAIGAYRCVTGLDESGMVIRSHLKVQGELPIAEALAREPLLPEDFAPIPQDAQAAFVTKFDSLAMVGAILPWFTMVGGDPDDVLDELSGGIEPVIGIDLKTLLGEVLDDTMTVYASPRDGGMVTGWVATVRLQDPMAARASFDQAIGFMRGQAGDDLEITTESYDGGDLVIFDAISEGLPFAITVGMSDAELVLGLMPQGVRSHLNRGEGQASLGDDPQVSQWFAYDNMNGDGLRTVVRLDHAEVVKLLHPLLVLYAGGLEDSMQLQDLEIDLSLQDLPSVSSLASHLKPMTGALIRVEDGYRWEVHQTAPGGDLIAAVPILATMTLPVTATAQLAGARTASSNNLRQIGLAFHNYHDTFQGMPAQANLDQRGRALLSWRVHILPYLGYAELYQQFHLDEPWDSDHNRALLAQMPPVYARPGLDTSEGLTSYLGVAGRGAIVGKAKEAGPNPIGNGFRDVTDGTSNTLMVVEVADAYRVPWTKPEDFEAAGMNPLEFLVGNWKGRFLALAADGAVHEIRDDIDEEVLQKLILMGDGEVVDWEKIVR